MIHSVGDSHARCSFYDIDEVMEHEIGPVTMESVGKQRVGASTSSGILNITLERSGISESDLAILCFGEIDVRCKIHPRILADEDEDSIINELIENFVHTVIHATHKNFWIMSITPPVSIMGQWNNEAFPFLGTDEERSRYARKMNEKLRVKAEIAGIPVLDVYDDYRDASGMLIPELSDGTVHIGKTEFVRQALRTLLSHEMKS